MADARAKSITDFMIRNYGSTHYIFDDILDLGRVMGKGDTVEIPIVANFTNRSATTRAAPESPTLSVDTLAADQEIFFNIAAGRREEAQVMNGQYGSALGRRALGQCMTDMDENLLSYLESVAWDTAGTYVHNAGANSLTDDDIIEAKAAALDAYGVVESDLRLVVSPYGSGSLENISTWIPTAGGGAAEQGRLGSPSPASAAGIPVKRSKGVPAGGTVASSAFANASNVQTITVAAGHGIFPGELVTFDTVTAGGDVASQTEVLSVTDTTVVIANAGADASATEAGTIARHSARNLLIDTDKVYGVRQKMPTVERVKDYESAAKGIQVYTCFGRVAHTGAVRVVLSPATSV